MQLPMKMPVLAKEFLEDFISLFFPKICIHCRTSLVYQEEHLCTSCRLSLPKTDYHLLKDNPLTQKFVYEPKVKAAAAFLHFNKGGIAQSVIHDLKYRGNKEVGEMIGRWYGQDLHMADWSVDVILPVPLHQRKQEKRGYNQSEHFAMGLGESLGVAVETGYVRRTRRTKTQTRKTKVERWQNIGSVYAIADPAALAGKRVLVVDDVLTTGATIGELAVLLADCQVASIYIVTMAAGR